MNRDFLWNVSIPGQIEPLSIPSQIEPYWQLAPVHIIIASIPDQEVRTLVRDEGMPIGNRWDGSGSMFVVL